MDTLVVLGRLPEDIDALLRSPGSTKLAPIQKLSFPDEAALYDAGSVDCWRFRYRRRPSARGRTRSIIAISSRDQI